MSFEPQKFVQFQGKLQKFTLQSEPGYVFGLGIYGESLSQKLTISLKGRATLTATNYWFPPEGVSAGEWMRKRLSTVQVEEIFDAMEKAFCQSPDYFVETCDGGFWHLALTNTDGKIFRYNGCMCEEVFCGATRISNLIRKALQREDLLCFDGAPELQYTYLSVCFEGNSKSYYYLTDDESIVVGDKVLVPVGNFCEQKMAQVVDIETFEESNLPMPLDKVKRVISKVRD